MTIIKQLISTETANWISTEAFNLLVGRPKYCAINAWQYLINADKIAHFSPNLSLFCATHATEEAVSAFIASAKLNGYRNEAKDINIRDHLHKTVIWTFARAVANHVQDLRFAFALHPEENDLYARLDRGNGPEYHPLHLGLISYNPDNADHSSDRAFEVFMLEFADDDEMLKVINRQTEIRNDTIYASKNGVPAITPKMLNMGLKEHTIITIGLIWAAMDMARHDCHKTALVTQALGAAKRLTEKIATPKSKFTC